MSWIMRAKILDIDHISVYGANTKVYEYEYDRIWYKWESVK